MHKNVSIIIPAYNESGSITACLEAVAAQTERPYEVIVVDNNSRDDTVRLASAFPFVTVISERRQGLFYARNTGLDRASGDILARIDADTIVDPTWVAAIRQAFEEPDVQAVSGTVGYYDMPFPYFVRRAEDVCLRVAKAGRYDFVMGANMALSRRAWRTVCDELCNQPFLFEDIDIAIHLLDHGVYPAYAPDMKALVSSRRLADKPRDFMRYIGGHTRTWKYHGLRPALGVYFAQAIFTMTYLGVKPLHMAYDPDLRRPSLTRLLAPAKARPDPMTTAIEG